MSRNVEYVEDSEEEDGKGLQNNYNLLLVNASDSDSEGEVAETEEERREAAARVIGEQIQQEPPSKDHTMVEIEAKGNESNQDEQEIEDEQEDKNDMSSDDDSPVKGSERRKSAPFRYFAETTCRRCGEKGHMQAECLSKVTVKPCLLCGQVGHEMKECPQAVCYRCGRIGHSSRDCKAQIAHVVNDNLTSFRTTVVHQDLRGCVCMVCGKMGHINCKETKYSKNLSLRGSQRGKARYEGQCCNCGGSHALDECKKPTIDEIWSERGFSNNLAACFICHKLGHIAATCPYKNANRQPHFGGNRYERHFMPYHQQRNNNNNNNNNRYDRRPVTYDRFAFDESSHSRGKRRSSDRNGGNNGGWGRKRNRQSYDSDPGPYSSKRRRR